MRAPRTTARFRYTRPEYDQEIDLLRLLVVAWRDGAGSQHHSMNSCTSQPPRLGDGTTCWWYQPKPQLRDVTAGSQLSFSQDVFMSFSVDLLQVTSFHLVFQ